MRWWSQRVLRTSRREAINCRSHKRRQYESLSPSQMPWHQLSPSVRKQNKSKAIYGSSSCFRLHGLVAVNRPVGWAYRGLSVVWYKLSSIPRMRPWNPRCAGRPSRVGPLMTRLRFSSEHQFDCLVVARSIS